MVDQVNREYGDMSPESISKEFKKLYDAADKSEKEHATAGEKLSSAVGANKDIDTRKGNLEKVLGDIDKEIGKIDGLVSNAESVGGTFITYKGKKYKILADADIPGATLTVDDLKQEMESYRATIQNQLDDEGSWQKQDTTDLEAKKEIAEKKRNDDRNKLYDQTKKEQEKMVQKGIRSDITKAEEERNARAKLAKMITGSAGALGAGLSLAGVAQLMKEKGAAETLAIVEKKLAEERRRKENVSGGSGYGGGGNDDPKKPETEKEPETNKKPETNKEPETRKEIEIEDISNAKIGNESFNSLTDPLRKKLDKVFNESIFTLWGDNKWWGKSGVGRMRRLKRKVKRHQSNVTDAENWLDDAKRRLAKETDPEIRDRIITGINSKQNQLLGDKRMHNADLASLKDIDREKYFKGVDKDAKKIKTYLKYDLGKKPKKLNKMISKGKAIDPYSLNSWSKERMADAMKKVEQTTSKSGDELSRFLDNNKSYK